jgi:isoleucyl-tRNA synthetase
VTVADYKSTLQLPKTDFPMRGNLSRREPEMIARWDREEIYARSLQRRATAPRYVFHDGPPYANGDIHHGHILNKALKDFVVKYKTMSGYYCEFVPGWDCHGLPIEHQVDKKLGKKKRDMTKAEVRKECRVYAEKYLHIQREQFKRIMVFADWQNPYVTMSYDYEAATVRELGRFFEKGLAYRGLKPVHWDWASQTALAEAEVEYSAHETEHVYVSFPCPGLLEHLASHVSDFPEELDVETSIAIWTTTPWTLPANLAIALHPDLDYQLIRHGDQAYVIAKGLAESVIAACDLDDTSVLATFSGRVLVGELGAGLQTKLSARHPFIDRESVLVPADHVTLEQGTGCVHTAPGHGQEDFVLGQHFGLDVLCPVDHRGRFLEAQVPQWGGLHVFAANPLVVEELARLGRLLNRVGDKTTIERYPHGWRSKKPVIFRATTQWFISMDGQPEIADSFSLRERALEVIDEVEWVPSWGRERIVGMVTNRPDWCISRQRTWGVPITVMHCGSCGEAIASKEIAFHVADLVAEHGADVWFERDSGDLVPDGTICPKCGALPACFQKEQDILDVWFDSGTSWAAVLEKGDGDGIADLYLEGSDQHRGWFQSSMMCGLATRDRSPFRTCLTHGFVTDSQGHKYSKSSKNFEDPKKMIDRYGADVLRLWVCSVDYRGDITLSDEILGRVGDSYRKIRNTFRFLLGNLDGFSPDQVVDLKDLEEEDRWILDRVSETLERVERAYANFQFHQIYHAFVQLCTVDFSNVYLDITKDRMYCEAPRSAKRLSGQTAYYLALHSLIRVMAPVLSFTTEEVWDHLPKSDSDPESVHWADFPAGYEVWRDPELSERWEALLEVRGEVQRALEAVRVPKKQKQPGQIGSSQEAHVRVASPPGTHALLTAYRDKLPTLWIVSSVELEELAESQELSVQVTCAQGGKCPRCWNYWITAPASDSICSRCTSVLEISS